MTPQDVGVTLAALLTAATLCTGSAATSTVQPSAFSSGVEMVPLTVTVSDGANGFVTGLTREDFTVLEDGVPQELAFFAAADVPVDLALLLDTSASMDSDLPVVRAAARGLLRTLGARDRSSVFAVNASVSVPRHFTGDHESVAAAIDSISARGGTALYASVSTSQPLPIRERRCLGKRAPNHWPRGWKDITRCARSRWQLLLERGTDADIRRGR